MVGIMLLQNFEAHFFKHFEYSQ